MTKLNRRTHRIADGEAEKATPESVSEIIAHDGQDNSRRGRSQGFDAIAQSASFWRRPRLYDEEAIMRISSARFIMMDS